METKSFDFRERHDPSLRSLTIIHENEHEESE